MAVTFDLNNTSTVTGFTNFTGSSLDDTFMWNGTGSSIFTLAGGSGTDSLKLYGGEATAYTLANLSMTSIEAIIGTSAQRQCSSGMEAGSYAFDLGGGSQDTLNVGTATSGKDIDLSTTTYKNIEILNGSSLNDTLRGGSLAESLWRAATARTCSTAEPTQPMIPSTAATAPTPTTGSAATAMTRSRPTAATTPMMLCS